VVNTAYLVCRNCGYKIQTPFVCWCDAPIHFIATCPKCGYRGVYSYTDLVVHNEEECKKSCRKLAEIKQKIDTDIATLIFADILKTILKAVDEAITESLKQKEENKKQ